MDGYCQSRKEIHIRPWFIVNTKSTESKLEVTVSQSKKRNLQKVFSSNSARTKGCPSHHEVTCFYTADSPFWYPIHPFTYQIRQCKISGPQDPPKPNSPSRHSHQSHPHSQLEALPRSLRRPLPINKDTPPLMTPPPITPNSSLKFLQRIPQNLIIKAPRL